ncbi:RBBP9/YdeN family alpha/beta hydrolase [Rothia sp. CCM 9418]|uniref:RBBP9/YdeN family alpha/beta hydrolase n=1 Tax=unclassified Rothia (in: high G+C Gram-positive bacteria) TaxID=2689056 RepID=UPI003AD3B940
MMKFLLVPGYMNCTPGHWSRWLSETYQDFITVEQDDWAHPIREQWLQQLHHTITHITEPLFLIGHSCGGALIAQWAEEYGQETHSAPVLGGILVAPADVESATLYPDIKAQSPLPSGKLPLPLHIIASTNDPNTTVERSKEFAQRWGTTLEFVKDGGHLDTPDGFGQWPYLAHLIEERSGQKLRPHN